MARPDRGGVGGTIGKMEKLGLSCLVEVCLSQHLKSSGSCSGILLDRQSGIILSHASVLIPAFGNGWSVENVCENLRNGRGIPDLKVHVTVSKPFSMTNPKEMTNKNIFLRNFERLKETAAATLSANQDCLKTFSVTDKTIERFAGHIEKVWKVDGFGTTLNRLMKKSDGWQFVDEAPVQTPKSELSKGSHKEDLHGSHTEPSGDQIYEWLPYFVLIRLDSWKEGKSVIPFMTEDEVQIGQRLYLEGTPFGSMSPAVFLNSVSAGIVSNITGPHHELFLTDARAIPGSEGGAVYVRSHDAWCLAGVVVAPLCWKSNEWVGLTICCSIRELLRSLQSTFSLELPRVDTLTTSIDNQVVRYAGGKLPAGVASVYRQVVLVRCGSSWGSGTLLPSSGVVLTCSHVIGCDKDAHVRIVMPGPKLQSCSATVTYCSREREVFDLAVLELGDGSSIGKQAKYTDSVKIGHKSQGEEVYAIGHACFDEYHGLQPSVSMGTVSKVISRNQQPIMIQSACAVHAGLSGGPLVAKDGTFVGIVACNARDSVSGASFPHINMSIPMATIWPVVKHYIETKDVAVLDQLLMYGRDSRLKSLWNLVDEGDLHVPSKL